MRPERDRNRSSSVMLVVDARRRDSLSNLLVAYWLCRMGYRVYIANLRNFQSWYPALLPAVTVLPSTFGLVAWCKSVQDETHLVLWQQELGNPHKEAYLLKLGGLRIWPPTFLDGLSRAYYWGAETQSWALEACLLRPEQILVTGTPRLDPYFLKSDFAEGSRKKALGLCPRFAHLNACDRRENIISEVEGLRSPERADLFYGKGKNIEDFMWYLIADLRLQFDLLERYDADIGGPSYIRPDPYEWEGGYHRIKEKYSDATVGNRLALWQWVGQLFCLVTAVSTSGIEALVAGVPVISTVSMMSDRLKEGISARWVSPVNLPFYWQPANQDQAVDMLRQAKSGDLPATPRPKEFSTYMKAYYNWPMAEPSSLTIARDLSRLADNPKPGWRAPTLGTLRRWNRLRRALMRDVSELTRDAFSGVFFAMQQRHWYPWDFLDRSAVGQLWKSLASSQGEHVG